MEESESKACAGEILRRIEVRKRAKVDAINELSSILAKESSGGGGEAFASWLCMRIESTAGALSGLREAEEIVAEAAGVPLP